MKNIVSVSSNSKQKKMEPTYLLNRKCENCNEPIADQEHDSRKHCFYQNIDGVVYDCKTEKHRKEDAYEREIFRLHKQLIKEMDKRIEAMLKEKGDKVSFEDLEAYDIHLDKSLHYYRRYLHWGKMLRL